MIKEFHSPNDHDKFQQWRELNATGSFLNCKTSNTAMLHYSDCHHSGNTDWHESKSGNLTLRRKICSEKREELLKWARDHAFEHTVCGDCKPTAS